MQLSKIAKYAKESVKEHPEIFEALLEFERTGKIQRPKNKKRANFTIDIKLLKEFQKYCKEHGYKMSTRIEKLVENELKKNYN
ncbi:MAG: hypothetical protein HYS32_04430 [Candidatus Woesearchaeota archaeon]|nr:MAG: hypothetical protein HYS32_04430 [Candidatus Woesearchaeota archaeon]